MKPPLPRAARRSRLTRVVLSPNSKAEADLSFIYRKLEHLRNILGLEADRGPHGGAAPKWLIDELAERRKRTKV